jgi:hypothetical protein
MQIAHHHEVHEVVKMIAHNHEVVDNLHCNNLKGQLKKIFEDKIGAGLL